MRGLIDPDLLFPAEERTRALARRLYAEVSGLPIVSPHGHTEPRWYALDEAFPDPAQLLIVPDHYVFRMLFQPGHQAGRARRSGRSTVRRSRRMAARSGGVSARTTISFAARRRGFWFDYTLSELFGIDELPSAASSDRLYDHVAECLTRPDYRPRALYERFNIEVISTTDSALDDLGWHAKILESGWKGRVVPAYRPDAVVDPDFQGFPTNLDKLGDITGADTGTWSGYLDAHRTRRAYFKDFGATSTDHGHATADTANLPQAEAAALFDKVRLGKANADERRLFRAQMLTEMAKMSLDDGLVMQIHPGSFRNHSPAILAKFGRDKGFDIPTRTDYVTALKPLLDAVGLERDLTVILFTLDETSYARELAPLAGVYPALKLGPAWWFHDSAEGMRRFREMTTETAGFYNTVGFNDDTRAFPSIPARHDIARRVDCAFLARLVAEHRLREDEAYELARDLAYGLAKEAYRL
ncbi:glucuronate isomerase (plasmid) [Sinorhizobium meliloti]|nr:glucuronate isomerase [Sinorhizobium meliloti]